MPAYLPRTLEAFLARSNRRFPVLLVTGPRQVGKTTILKHLSGARRTYVTLDDSTLAMLARQEPRLFLERFKPPLLIDEIQYAPELLPHIKMRVDKDRKAGQFWLTGSQQFHLMKGVSESLAGRVGIVNLGGLSLWEREGLGKYDTPFLPTPAALAARQKRAPQLDLPQVYERIWRGAFPAIALDNKMDRQLFYSSYVQTYLQRDMRDLARVGDELAFLKFLRAAAARTGQLLNMADMARDCGISPPTAKSWLSILQTTGLIYLLEPYATNVTKRLVKAPKLYMTDTGLAAHLTEWSSPRTLEAGAMAGAMLETFVVSEILKSYWHNGKNAPLYFYRDKSQREIDLLIVQDGTVYPLEIKKSGSPSADMMGNQAALQTLHLEIGHGGVICLSPTLLPLSKTISAIPVGLV